MQKGLPLASGADHHPVLDGEDQREHREREEGGGCRRKRSRDTRPPTENGEPMLNGAETARVAENGGERLVRSVFFLFCFVILLYTNPHGTHNPMSAAFLAAHWHSAARARELERARERGGSGQRRRRRRSPRKGDSICWLPASDTTHPSNTGHRAVGSWEILWHSSQRGRGDLSSNTNDLTRHVRSYSRSYGGSSLKPCVERRPCSVSVPTVRVFQALCGREGKRRRVVCTHVGYGGAKRRPMTPEG